MKRKRGRPKKAAGETKSQPIQIRADAKEKAGFEAAAELAGLSLSAWIRERLRLSARKELRDAGKPNPFLD